MATLSETSDGLHDRVQRFARDPASDSFAGLALDIARFQLDASEGFRRLVRARVREPDALDDIPPVPSDAFRLTRVAAFGPEHDAVRFFTSGTTGAERGNPRHAPHRHLRNDCHCCSGRQALLAPQATALVVALAPPPTTPPSSSLGYMMARFMEAFDGEPLDAKRARRAWRFAGTLAAR